MQLLLQCGHLLVLQIKYLGMLLAHAVLNFVLDLLASSVLLVNLLLATSLFPRHRLSLVALSLLLQSDFVFACFENHLLFFCLYLGEVVLHTHLSEILELLLLVLSFDGLFLDGLWGMDLLDGLLE